MAVKQNGKTAPKHSRKTESSPNLSPRVAVISDDGVVSKSYSFSDFMSFATNSKIQLKNLQSNTSHNPTYHKYTKTQIVTYLENPATNEKALRYMSQYIYNVSNYYRRLIQYFANMPTFAYVVSPLKLNFSKTISPEKVKKAYQNASDTLTNMNIAHEFGKALTVAFRDDVFYGTCFETKDSFSIMSLNADYCKISSIEDGVYNFAFDFSYFDSYAEELPNYPAEFSSMYTTYRNQGSSFRWQELSSKNSVCIKINETEITPIPPFVSLFSALADIEDYRAIALDASEISNYKALALQIPVDDKGNLLIDLDIARDFYQQLVSVLPSNIGAILTPMEITSWDFEKSGAVSESDLVSSAESVFWSQAGVNELLFGGGKNPSSNTLGLSTVSDQAIVFRALRQIERWINRKLKSLSGTIKFKITFLDVTRYNIKEMHDQYLKDGQYGLPVRSAIMATSGLQQPDQLGLAYLENTVLDMQSYEVPLKSSNVQSGDPTDTGGRPTAEESGTTLTDAGEASREEN